MNKLLKNIVSIGAIWFVAGALFAVGANIAAPLMGAGEIASLAGTINPVWLGSMMAGATMIATALEPFIQKVFGNDAVSPVARVEKETGTPTPEVLQDISLGTTKFQQNLQAQRNDAEKILTIG